MKRPYLTPKLDEDYQLIAKRSGWQGLWGRPTYYGNYRGYAISFDMFDSGRTSYPETGITMIVPKIPDLVEIGYEQLINSFSSPPPPRFLQHIFTDIYGHGDESGLFFWLKSLLVPRHELLKYNHQYAEVWYTNPEQIIMNIIWTQRKTPDWTILNSVVERLYTIAELAISHYQQLITEN